MPKQYYAHSLSGKPSSDWQKLELHLANVARKAGEFAALFDSSEWAEAVGWLHDLGKFPDEFQEYLLKANDLDASIESAPGRVDHSTAGAQYAVRSVPILGHLLAYAVAGHHTGLPNGLDITSCLESRLRKAVPPYEDAVDVIPVAATINPPPFLQHAFGAKDPFAIAFFVRMIFSCLVDADFLDTEMFMNPQQAGLRKHWPDNILARMDEALTQFIRQFKEEEQPVNRERQLVRMACLKAAGQKPGFFSLTVPTGGGKTLASLAFSLRHALANAMKRVIYVIPLTSIIEQNADVFREAFMPLSRELGADVVLEHHSSLDPEKETAANRLASENWDAPLVITTSVQFYESLYANRTSRCRKLHRLAQSVVILDEAQTLPVDYLKPCLQALQELVSNYRSTVVLCTATQPVVEKREGFEIGISKPYEIIPDPIGLYNRLERVRTEYIGNQSDDLLCERLLAEPRVLCIVNTKPHARKLFEAMGAAKGHFHLSGNMCPSHRSEKLRKIKDCLQSGQICRVVSTQVIEAGVDVDFPVVYRALAGLDSIAQAAGRCNRNGRLVEQGRTYIFRSEHTKAERFLTDTAQCAGQVLSLCDNPLDLEAIEHYFRLYYWDQSYRWDRKHIMDCFCLNKDPTFPFNFGFKKVAAAFQLIDEADSCPVIIPWRKAGRRLCEQVRAMPSPTLEIRRQLQRFVVQIPRRTWERHVGGSIHLVHDSISILVSPDIHYSDETGLNLEGEGPGAIFV